MQEQIEKIRSEALSAPLSNLEEIENYRLKFLARKGSLTALFDEFKKLPGPEKKEFGKLINILKQEVTQRWETAKERKEESSDFSEDFDPSLPPPPISLGSRHPVNLVIEQMTGIFEKMGFNIETGPEVESDWYNFSALNFPPDHPARDMQDTFFVDADHALRTHTSSVQIRVMETQKPPIKVICPGRVYRNEAISARSHCYFHQIEGLHIGENISFAHLKSSLFEFVRQFFGPNVKSRFRSSYFPFTEPSAEMDIYLGTDTEEDRRLTKGTGWLEILGCGMVHRNVLENCGIDYKKYTGYAFGIGIERITMFKYGIKDIRQLSENDKRFLSQFKSVSTL